MTNKLSDETAHQWAEEGVQCGFQEQHWTFCKKCLIVKRADGKNKPCKGIPKLTLREKAKAELEGKNNEIQT